MEMDEDKQQELTDHDIKALVDWSDNEDDEDNTWTGLGLDRMERISHSEGVKPLEEAQQGEAIFTDVMLLRCQCDRPARKRSNAW